MLPLRALLDVNMLLALADTSHVHHARARSWQADHLGERGWASCPLTQNGFLRVSTLPSYGSPKPWAEAMSLLDQMVARHDHEFWPDDFSVLDATIIERSRLLGPRQITDVYLLAIAVKHDGRFVTLDRNISLAAVRGAEARHLVTV